MIRDDFYSKKYQLTSTRSQPLTRPHRTKNIATQKKKRRSEYEKGPERLDGSLQGGFIEWVRRRHFNIAGKTSFLRRVSLDIKRFVAIKMGSYGKALMDRAGEGILFVILFYLASNIFASQGLLCCI